MKSACYYCTCRGPKEIIATGINGYTLIYCAKCNKIIEQR